MKMTLRWFGTGYDSVTLEQIRQIPGVTGVVTTLYYKQPGEVWELSEIMELKNEVESAGLKIEGIESVNIHDSIKTGSPKRDKYIDNYLIGHVQVSQKKEKMGRQSCLMTRTL